MTGPKTRFAVLHRFSFESAHQLPGHPTCGTVHGHSYRGEIRVSARSLDAQGMVLEFAVLKEITDAYDHGPIITDTVERLAAGIGQAVLDRIAGLADTADIETVRVVVWETPNGCAEWSWSSS